MTKKKKGQDGEADEDREQSRTPIRSELDKMEGILKGLSIHTDGIVLYGTLVNCVNVL